MLELQEMMWLHGKMKNIADEIVNEAVACCDGEINADQFYFENAMVEDLWGQKIRFAAKLPQFFEDEGYSLYLVGMCDSRVDCDVAGYITLREKEEVKDVVAGLEELGCSAEVDDYTDTAEVHFKCSKITEKDLKNIVDFVGGHAIDQWYYFYDMLCDCED